MSDFALGALIAGAFAVFGSIVSLLANVLQNKSSEKRILYKLNFDREQEKIKRHIEARLYLKTLREYIANTNTKTKGDIVKTRVLLKKCENLEEYDVGIIRKSENTLEETIVMLSLVNQCSDKELIALIGIWREYLSELNNMIKDIIMFLENAENRGKKYDKGEVLFDESVSIPINARIEELLTEI